MNLAGPRGFGKPCGQGPAIESVDTSWACLTWSRSSHATKPALSPNLIPREACPSMDGGIRPSTPYYMSLSLEQMDIVWYQDKGTRCVHLWWEILEGWG